MRDMRRIAAIAACLLPLLAGPVWPQSASSTGRLTVYRCTDAGGRVSLRDTPCPKGQQQQTQGMLRPQDAPPPPPATPTPVAPAAPAPAPAVVYRSPPQPLFECVTPDGDRYTSDNGDGRPRWVPLWTLGWSVYGPRDADRGTFRPAPPPSAAIGRPQLQPPPAPATPRPGYPGQWTAASGGGTWIRDSCTMLPQAEVCARLRDRRDAIRSRSFNAQEKERNALRLEERGVLARLDNDCGDH
jgi:hypothetical protein